ncbi:MAG: DMT family transporter [Alphaproteobacteria bacterium]
MKPAHILLALMTMVIWGLNFVMAKIGLAEFPPLLLIGLRFTLVAVLLVAFVPVPKDKLPQILAVSVVMGSLHFSLMFTGLTKVDASVAAIAVQVQVPFSSLLAAMFFGDKLGWRRAVAMAVAFVGIAIIAGEPRMETKLAPLAMVIAGAFLWAVGSIQVKQMGRMNEFSMNAWMAVFTAPQLFIASALFESGQIDAIANASWAAWGSIAYMAVFVTIVGYGLWYYLLPRYPVNQTMPFILLMPAFGVLFGVWLLDELLTWQMMVGGALTLAGVGVIVVRRPALAEPEV